MDKLITYQGKLISVPEEVAEFLESDRRAMAAQRRQDRRHLSKSSFERVLDSYQCSGRYDLEDLAFRNLSLESLRMSIAKFGTADKRLLFYRFERGMTLKKIGKRFGISKMAISKRLKKLARKLRDCAE